jgi:hypothetical protein
MARVCGNPGALGKSRPTVASMCPLFESWSAALSGRIGSLFKHLDATSSMSMRDPYPRARPQFTDCDQSYYDGPGSLDLATCAGYVRQTLTREVRGGLRSDPTVARIGTLGLAIAVGTAYFRLARLKPCALCQA